MRITNKKEYDQFIQILRGLSAGQEFIDFQRKIVKTQKEIVGVRTPELRKMAKQISREPHDAIFEYGQNNIFEEVLLKGFLIGKEKDFEKGVALFEKLAMSFDSWAEVDMICSNLAFVKNNENLSFKFFSKLLKSDHEFICRSGVVGLMKCFLSEDQICTTLNALDEVECDKYYVNMAIAWLISEIIVQNPQNAEKNMQNIIKNHHFNRFIINKSIQKAIESYRIDKQLKDKLREMKI